ncbi:MAG: hypothetical protein OEM63_15825 [Gammaproteobacteria bacterium]|nr:hypothetical protein [Gammaproteobacteria bacterium]
MLTLLAAIATACQSIPPSFVTPYQADPEVQAKLLEFEGALLSVDVFDTAPGAVLKMQCREQSIQFPRFGSVSEYIRNAIETELSAAGMYDQEASGYLTGTLNRAELRIDGRLASGAIGATWIIEIDLHSSNGRSMRVRSGRAYRTSFEVINCPEAAGALMPAVQKLLRTAVTEPSFPALVRI